MYSLLQSAAIYGGRALAKYLLEHKGADPNFRNQFGESLLLLCSKGGHLDVLEVFRDVIVGIFGETANVNGQVLSSTAQKRTPTM